ncbi:hypothetical protein SODG_006010 [Sodalis praecaptivus]
MENCEFLITLFQLPLEAGNLSSLFALSFRRRCLDLLFAAPVIELRLIQAEFACGSGNADAFSEFKGFIAKFRRVFLLIT